MEIKCGTPLLIAGPCSAESESQLIQTASELKDAGIDIFRAGIWKPRTRPGCFEGMGAVALPWMARVKSELGLKVSTEVAGAKHVEECLKHGIDVLWVGARTSANPFLMQEIADALKGTDVPVFVKNPVNPDLALWMGAIERLSRAGLSKIGVIHRGFSSLDEQKYRNAPGWQIAIELRSRCPELPFLCDPSHMAGSKALVPELAQTAMDLGLDGLMVESHHCPECALSDSAQQLTPAEFKDMISGLVIRKADTKDSGYKENISQLRIQIDEIDGAIIRALAHRMEISRKIGDYKKNHNIAILQPERWDTVMDNILEKAAGLGLEGSFMEKIYNAIHEASAKEQSQR